MRQFAAFAGILLGAALNAGGAARVLVVDVDRVVHPITVEIVASAIERATQEKADLILMRLNTPGGLMEATRQVIEKIVASPVPVVTYVAPSGGRAASAGFFLLEAGDVAAMAPGTNTGAAHPLVMGVQMDAVLKQKLENDAAASLRSLVSKRGRNAELAEKAVLESKSFTDQEALKNRLIELVARDEADLLRQLEGREIVRFDGSRRTLRLTGATLDAYQKSTRQKIFSGLSDPNLALMMLVLGALGIYLEFSSPGLILPGVAGAILFLLGLSAIAVLPVSWTGVALLVIAGVLFVLEAKVASHGILGAGGTVALILGAVLLVEAPIPELRIRLSTAIALALPFALITLFLLRLIIRARAGKVETGTAGMLGAVGVAMTELAPGGRVFIHGEYWSAVASSSVAAGARVRVTAVDGLNLTVEPISTPSGG